MAEQQMTAPPVQAPAPPQPGPQELPPITSTAPTPPPVSTPTPSPSEEPKLEDGGELGTDEKANWKFTSKDIITILFFSGGIAMFLASISYFRGRRKLLTTWQAETNDDLLAIKGKVKSLETTAKAQVQKIKQDVDNW